MRRKLAIRWRRSEGQVHDRSYRANHATCPSDRTKLLMMCEYSMNFSIFGVNLTWRAEKPLQKGIGASEVGSFNLTLTSLLPHLNLTSTSFNIIRYKGIFKNVHFNNSERAFFGGKDLQFQKKCCTFANRKRKEYELRKKSYINLTKKSFL